MTFLHVTALLPGLIIHPGLVYNRGPKSTQVSSAERILEPVLHVIGADLTDRRLMQIVVQKILDLGGGRTNAWFGIAEEYFRPTDVPALCQLVERCLLIREIGVPDENSHELRTVYFLHPRVVDAFVESLPPSM